MVDANFTMEFFGGPFDGERSQWSQWRGSAEQTLSGKTKDGLPAYATYVRAMRGGRPVMLFVGYCERGDEAIDLVCRGQGVRRIQ